MDLTDPAFTVKVDVLAFLLDLTDTRIQQLSKPKSDGTSVIVKASRGEYKLAASLQGYARYLQKLSRAGGGGDGSGVIGTDGTDEGDYGKHRARLYRFKADKAEVEAKLLKGEVHHADAIKSVWGDMVGAAKGKFLGMATTLAGQLEGMDTAERREAILDSVHDALRELADYSPEILTGEYVRNQDDPEESEEDEPEDDGEESDNEQE